MAFSLRAWLLNIGKRYIVLVIWTGLCGFLFWRTYKHYKWDPEFFYIYQMLGEWLCLSRASAAVVNLNCGMVLIPMCRASLTIFRTFKVQPRTLRLMLDASKGFHVACAYLIVIMSILHSSAHLVNALNFSTCYNSLYPNINAASYRNQNPLVIILTSVPGVTGVCMVIVLCCIVTSSTKLMREHNYDLFWYSHRLFALMYLFMLVHALRILELKTLCLRYRCMNKLPVFVREAVIQEGPVKKQMNTSHHRPGCSFDNQSMPMPHPEYHHGGDEVCNEEPKFDSVGLQSWLWVGGPLLVYIIDYTHRVFRRIPTVSVIKVNSYPGDILEIQMSRDGFKAKPGQYVLLQCGKISTFEWHPFTLTLCPTKESVIFSSHVRASGDWSARLHAYLLAEKEVDTQNETPSSDKSDIRLRVDGPFSSPMEDLLKFPVLVCIAGGIGITPFAAFFNYLKQNNEEALKLSRIYLIWISREVSIFTCFANIIHQVHLNLWNGNKPDVLECHFHSTSKDDHSRMEESVSREDNDFVTSRLTFGRPNWEEFFRSTSEIFNKTKVGVFCCGPKVLYKDIQRQCYRKYSSDTTFLFHHESF